MTSKFKSLNKLVIGLIIACLCFAVGIFSLNNGKEVKPVFAETNYSLSSDWLTKTGINRTSIESLSFEYLSAIPGGYGEQIEVSTGIYASYKTLDSGNYDIVVWSAGNIFAPSSCNSLFQSYSALTTLTFNNFNTTDTTVMSFMFRECSKLISLDLRGFNTANVTSMYEMFSGCSSLADLDLSNFITSNVISMYEMFSGCKNLTTINLDNFVTTNCGGIVGMFKDCSSLTSLNLSHFDTSKASRMDNMFRGCNSLTSLDISNFNTSNVTDMSYMFFGCMALTSLDVSSFDTSKVSTMLYMFSDCGALTSLNLSNFNTSKVTNMAHMFADCSKLEELNVSNFNTSNVTDMYWMFDRCSSLTSLDVTNFDTSNVTDMYCMFQVCSSLTSIDVSNFNTEKVTNFSHMFGSCSGLTSLNVSNFNTSKATDVNEMFSGCSSLKNLDITNFDTTNVKNMEGLFRNCSGLTSIDISKLDTSNVTSMKSMFYGCSGLTTIDLSGLNASKVVNMTTMFYGCSGLESIDLSGLDTSNVKYLSDSYGYWGMFENCTSLESIDLSSLNLSNVTLARYLFKNCTKLQSVMFPIIPTSSLTTTEEMFINCTSLTNIDFNGFSTSKVTTMLDMFRNCTSLKTLDLSSFDTTKVESFSGMFYNCTSLESVNLISFVTDSLTDMGVAAPYGRKGMFQNCTSLKSIDLSHFNTSKVTNMVGLFWGCSSLTDVNISGFIMNGVDTELMFNGCSSLKSLDLSNISVSGNYSVYEMFYGCTSLEYLDMSGFDFTGASTSGLMFSEDTILKAYVTPYVSDTSKTISVYLPVSLYVVSNPEIGPIDIITNNTSIYGINTLNKTLLAKGYEITYKDKGGVDLTGTFVETSPEVHLYGSTTMLATPTKNGYEFKGWYLTSDCSGEPVTELNDTNCTSNTTLYAEWEMADYTLPSNWLNATGLTKDSIEVLTFDYLEAIPEGYSKQIQVATGIYVSYKTLDSGNYDVVVWSAGNIYAPTSCSSLFAYYTSLVTITFNNFNTSNVTSMSSMFSMSTKITALDLSMFDTSNVIYMSSMFYNCQDAEVIDVSSFNTSNVTTMEYMFEDCHSVTSLDLSNFDVQNVTTMRLMFFQCVRTKTIKFSVFNTKSVTDMYKMFYYCNSLTSIDLSSFNTSNVTNMSYMFYHCTSLTKLDASSFDTANVTDMSHMFNLCDVITSLNVSSFNTSNVTNMEGMFGCEKLYSLDVSNFDTRKVTDMSSMFSACRNLSSLNVSNFVTDNVTDMSYMFSSCYALKTLDLSNFNTSKVTNMCKMFGGCSALTSLNISSFDTSKVTNMGDMFNYCEVLTTLDVSHFDTANVTTMSYMFHNCRKLTAIDVSNFDTTNVTSIAYMFNECYAVKELDVSGFNTSKVEYMDYMFSRCYQISSLDLSNFDTTNVTSMAYMFRSSAISKLDLSNFDISSVTDVSNMFDGANALTLLITPYVSKSSVTISIDLPKTFYTIGNNGVISVTKATNDASVYGISTLNKTILSTEYFTITYKDKGNATFTGTFEETSPDVYLPGATVTLIKPTKPANEFKGWYLTSDCSGEPITQLTSDIVTSNITLYALWEKANVSITSNWLSVTALNKAIIETLTFDSLEAIPEGYSEKIEVSTDIYASYKTLASGNYDMIVWSPGNIYAPVNCGSLFAGYSALTTLVFNNFNTSLVTNMSYMFYGCCKLTTLDVSKFNTENVTDMSYMFALGVTTVGDEIISELTTLNVSNFNTSKVTNMSHMFYSCTRVESLDVSGFDTGLVTNMSYMFSNAYPYWMAITSLDLSSFDTSNVTDMSGMFEHCSRIESLDLSSFDTSNVTNMSHMFCMQVDGALTSLNISSFNTSKVTDMSAMFDNCVNLVTLDLSNFDTSNVTDMGAMFADCDNLKTLNISSFNTSNVVSMRVMFRGILVTTLDISHFDTSKVTDMGYMFEFCPNLTTINLGNINTANVTDMAGMFRSTPLTTIDVSGFDTSNVTDMSYMFSGCGSLTSLDLSSFNTSKVTNMEQMFRFCSSLTSLDVTSFNTSKVRTMSGMFYWCGNLKTLDLSSFDVVALNNSQDFLNGTHVKRIITPYTSGTSDKSIALPNVYYLVGDESYTEIKSMQNYTSTYGFSTLNKNTLVVGYNLTYKDKGNAGFTGTFAETAPTVHLYGETTALVSPTRDGKVFKGWYLTSDCSGEPVTELNDTNCTSNTTLYAEWEMADYTLPSNWLNATGLTNKSIEVLTFDYLEEIPEGYSKQIAIATGIYASYKTLASGNYDMIVWSPGNIFAPEDSSYLFHGLENLKSISFKNFDTTNVVKMGEVIDYEGHGMFGNCKLLTNLDLSGFNTSNVTNMDGMFAECNALTSINLSSFNTSKVTSMLGMFYNCNSLTSLDLSSFDTSEVTDMYAMFYTCESLASLDLSGFNTLKVTDMTGMFNGCSSLTNLNVSKFNTSNVTTMDAMFANCSSLTNLNISNFNTSNVTSMDSMFADCSSLTSLNISNFNTSNVTTMDAMFAYCSSLTSLNLTNFNTSNVTTMDSMFAYCSSLISLDLTSFDVSNVTNIDVMFYECSALQNIYFSEFNTEKVTDMSGMFCNCSSLTSLDLSGFNTSSVTTMLSMFYGCSALTDIDLTSFNTANVTNMNSMFFNCSNLTSLDLTSFDVSNVENMCVMFYECKALENIDILEFNTKKVTDMSGMFFNCSSLTSLDLSSFNTSSVTDMQSMFQGCSALTALDLSSFNTSKVTDMYQMFAYCSALTSLDVSGFNTENVTDMMLLFYNCSSLTSLDLSSFNTSSVTTMLGMFQGCSALTALDLSSFNTSNVTDMYQMFALCSALTSLDVSGFNTENVTNMHSMFYNCNSLISLDLSSFDLKSVTDVSYMFTYVYFLKTLKTPYCSDTSKTINLSLPALISGSWYNKFNPSAGSITTYTCSTASTELVVGYTITYKDSGATSFTGTFSSEYPTLRLYGENITLVNPTKAGYRFAGWYLTSDCSGEAVTTLTDNNCVRNTTLYAKWVGRYNITWANYNGEVLYIETLDEGAIPAYTGDIPTRQATAQYTYTFSGWTPQIVAVTKDATYTATFTETVNKYTIKWLNYNSEELLVEQVEYGKVPSYTGETPQRERTAQYTYTFSGWTPQIVAVTKDATYTATFTEIVNKYTIKWLNYNSQELLVEQVEYGKTPSYTGEAPVKEGNAQYSYTFSGWTPQIVAVTKDATYMATFTESVNKYTIIWTNYNGEELLKEEVEYGVMPKYTGETPVKEGNAQYTYTFFGWSPEIVVVTEDATYTATFTETINKYTITWLNYNGEELLKEEVEYGIMPKYTGVTPVKEGDAQYTYTFSGWTPQIVAVTEDATYTANFTESVNKYTIKWLNYNSEELLVEQVEYGKVPSYTGETPQRGRTAQYTYTFSGWTPQIVAVTKDATYTATFTETVNKYTITWLNYNSEELLVEQVEYGKVPSYTGETPQRERTAQYTYTFSGWNPKIVAVTEDATYTATFTATINKYTITWLNYNGEELLKEEVEYGVMPKYTGETPVKAGDDQYTYTFTGWTPELVIVTKDATYTATFADSTNVYTITWLNYDNTLLLTTDVEFGSTPVYTGETPVKAGDAQYSYTFSGWTPNIVVVTGEATYTATFTETINKYTITWLNYNGAELLKEEVEYGKVPSYTGETPQRGRTAQYTYTFSGWTPQIVAVTKDATYTAIFTETVNKYTITWLNYNSEELLVEQVEYGKVPSYTGETPQRERTAQYTYTFSGWNPKIVAVTEDATYKATFTETVNKYTITWLNYNGEELLKEEVEYGVMPKYTGETPVKAGDDQYTYTFTGWTPELVIVTKDATYTATFADSTNVYTITWLNYDNTLLLTTNVEYGSIPKYTGETPVKAGDAQYSYTFSGWSPEVVAVTDNATYTATFTESVNKYTITWLNYNSEKLLVEQVEYGKVPSYTGETPQRGRTAQYTYTFSGWSPELVIVTKDATYKATFTETVNKYTITWLNYNSEELLVEQVEYGKVPSYTGETPQQEKTAQYTYTFSGWSPEIVAVTGNATYTATFTETINKYIITWLNYNGEELLKEEVEYGVMPKYTGETPEKQGDDQYTYTFTGWTPEVVIVTEDATYTATFADSAIKYTIIWLNYDGTELYRQELEYGEMPEYKGETPEKEGNAQYSYIFAGWLPEMGEVTGDITYTAQFTEIVNKYTITWKNYDDTTLLEEQVEYGQTPDYTGETPTREGNAEFTYTFSGWTPEIELVTKDAIYTAQYTATVNKYLVIWLNHDGTELYREELEYGEVPEYKGELPVKEGDAQYSYTFAGWIPEIAEVTGDITYTAQFTESINKYTITWKNYDGTTLLEEQVEYGQTPVYTGETPTRESDAEFTYTFSGWTPEIELVTKDAEYTAEFSSVVNKYTIIWLNYDNTELYRNDVEYGQMPEYTGETPVKEGNAEFSYTFTGWTPEVVIVTGEATYTATFAENVNTYTITWTNYNGKELYSEELEYGVIPNYTGETPVKEGNAQYSYTFSGWSPEIVEVTEDATYTATFTESVNKYTITWINYDNAELLKEELEYGEMPSYSGETPSRPSDDDFKYTFSTWEPEIEIVTGDATYKAVFTSVELFEITWKNYDGTILKVDKVERGTMPEYGNVLPIRPKDAQYRYTFTGWTPDLVVATSDATYTAVFETTVNTYIINVKYVKGDEVLGMVNYTVKFDDAFALNIARDNLSVLSVMVNDEEIEVQDNRLEIPSVTEDLNIVIYYTETITGFIIPIAIIAGGAFVLFLLVFIIKKVKEKAEENTDTSEAYRKISKANNINVEGSEKAVQPNTNANAVNSDIIKIINSQTGTNGAVNKGNISKPTTKPTINANMPQKPTGGATIKNIPTKPTVQVAKPTVQVAKPATLTKPANTNAGTKVPPKPVAPKTPPKPPVRPQ